ncbi:hypothetical protein Tco_1054884 [Tanacetum coccineum]|uniref:Uncharacterized protein n=1 Tax=Tanacetum coccineum TaxID=301880 RepID=A0ABQ5H037_9ASTR
MGCALGNTSATSWQQKPMIELTFPLGISLVQGPVMCGLRRVALTGAALLLKACSASGCPIEWWVDGVIEGLGVGGGVVGLGHGDVMTGGGGERIERWAAVEWGAGGRWQGWCRGRGRGPTRSNRLEEMRGCCCFSQTGGVNPVRWWCEGVRVMGVGLWGVSYGGDGESIEVVGSLTSLPVGEGGGLLRAGVVGRRGVKGEATWFISSCMSVVGAGCWDGRGEGESRLWWTGGWSGGSWGTWGLGCGRAGGVSMPVSRGWRVSGGVGSSVWCGGGGVESGEKCVVKDLSCSRVVGKCGIVGPGVGNWVCCGVCVCVGNGVVAPFVVYVDALFSDSVACGV